MPAELVVDRDYRGKPQARQRAIAELAARQHGVIARHQLSRFGLDRDAIDYRILCGRLHIVHRGVFSAGHRRLTRHGRWMAAVLAAGPNAVLSHRSAAALWDLDRPPDSVPDVTRPTNRTQRPGLRIHRAALAKADTAVVEGIPVTSLPRTLLDLAAVAPGLLVRAIEESERLNLFDLGAMSDLIARSRGRRGVARLRAAVAAYQDPGHTRSELERRFLRVVHDAGLPLPSVNCFIAGYEVDALWRREQLVVELDGYAFHSTRGAWERDRLRDDDLALAGFRVVRLTWSRLHEPGIADRLTAHLERRRRELGLTRTPSRA